jgi:hypothetical protein
MNFMEQIPWGDSSAHSWSRMFSFYETEGSLPCSQQPVVGPYPSQNNPIHTPTLFT